MIIHINGRPGVGKLTIGRVLAEKLGARLLDNHSVYNVGFSLTTFETPAFYETVRAVRKVAYERILDLGPDVPVVLTNSHSQDSIWGNECWDAVIELAKARGSKLYVVVLHCSSEEHQERLRSPERAGKRKPMDPAFFTPPKAGRQLIDRDGDGLLHQETAGLTAQQSAGAIAAWVAERP